MKRLIVVAGTAIFSMGALVGAFSASMQLDQEVDKASTELVALAEKKPAGFMNFVMNILSFYEARFEQSNNEKGLYMVNRLQNTLQNNRGDGGYEDPDDTVNSDDSGQDCEAAGGTWLAEYNECEYINASSCSQLGGSFNECASSCRHMSPDTMCIMSCVPVCSFESEEPAGNPVGSCEIRFDGCNTCSMDDYGNITGCTKKYCQQQGTPGCIQREQPTDNDLQNCVSWYDGCNTCGVENGKITACTEMACLTQGQPKCLEYEQMPY